jgi:hypothetical protein
MDFTLHKRPACILYSRLPSPQIKMPKKQITEERCRENGHGDRPRSQKKMTGIVELGFSKGRRWRKQGGHVESMRARTCFCFFFYYFYFFFLILLKILYIYY